MKKPKAKKGRANKMNNKIEGAKTAIKSLAEYFRNRGLKAQEDKEDELATHYLSRASGLWDALTILVDDYDL